METLKRLKCDPFENEMSFRQIVLFSVKSQKRGETRERREMIFPNFAFFYDGMLESFLGSFLGTATVMARLHKIHHELLYILSKLIGSHKIDKDAFCFSILSENCSAFYLFSMPVLRFIFIRLLQPDSGYERLSIWPTACPLDCIGPRTS